MTSLRFRATKQFFTRAPALAAPYVCEVILVISLFFSFKFQQEYNNYEKIIKSDGHGYYAYLPAVFIYNDYDFSFIQTISEKYIHINLGPGFMNETPDGNVNKYFVGASLFWLPFFLIAHLIATLFGLSADGYSWIYQLSVLIAANFYLWVGCRYLFKLILRYPVSETIASFIVLLIVFGTNLFFYVTFDSCFTHVYSFAAVSGFLYFLSRFFETKNAKELYWSAFFLGIITLLRPTNIVIVLLVFFFAGSLKHFLQTMVSFKKELLLSALLFLITLFPQFLLYYLQTGHFIVWSYGTESFNFLDPYIYETLFSYKKGMFIYAPLLLISILGLSYLHRHNMYQFRTMMLFLFVNTYIISSWWCWWYGDSLGQRSFIDTYGVLGILLALAYISLNSTYAKGIYIVTGSVFVYYSMILTYQYRHNIIDQGGMIKQSYWYTFMKTDTTIARIATYHELFTGIKSANIVNIKASNNRFLSAASGESYQIIADKDHSLSWEFYNLVRLPENKVAFKCYDGNYISARLDNELLITHSVKELREWEKFEMIFLKQNSFVLKACNERYVVREKELFRANGNDIADAEEFLLINK